MAAREKKPKKRKCQKNPARESLHPFTFFEKYVPVGT
jgi:hypothetical protein